MKTVKLQVKPFLLLKPDINFSAVEKPKAPFKLFDRVVVVRRTHQVPLGFKGTIISIHPISDPNPVRLENVKTVDNTYEILFDRELPDGHGVYGIANGRVCKVAEGNLVMIYQNNTNKNGLTQNAVKDPQPWRRESTSEKPYFERQTEAGATTDSDFWNPERSDNSKPPMNNFSNVLSPRQTPRTKLEFNSNDSYSQKQTEPDPVDHTTNQLKSMLGISGPSKRIEPHTLPQPPANWRSDALNWNQRTQYQDTPSQSYFNQQFDRQANSYQQYQQQPPTNQKPLVFYSQKLPQFAVSFF